MVRRNHPKQLSGQDLDKFLQAAEGLHKAIVCPLISPTCEHFRSTRTLHEVLLKPVRERGRKSSSSGGMAQVRCGL